MTPGPSAPSDPDAQRLSEAAASGDGSAVAAVLERRPELLQARIGPRAWEPILYLCFGKEGAGDAARAELAKKLLALGANPNASWLDLPHWPNSPQAALYGATGVNDYPRLARVLLEAGADPNDCESRYHAAEHNHVACLEVLLEFGTDFSGRDKSWGNTPLYFLFGYRHPPESAVRGIEWILDHGADVNVASGKQREMPLHRAITNFWPVAMIERLVAAGADVNARRLDGVGAFAMALRSARPEVAAVLARHGADQSVTPEDKFLGACLAGDTAAAHRCLEKDPNLRKATSAAQWAIVAAQEDRAKALHLLGDLGVDLNAPDEGGATPLHWAAWHGRARAVEALLHLGADLNPRDKTYDAPPLGWCNHGWQYCPNINGDYAAVARQLLAAGAAIPAGFEPCPPMQAAIASL